MSRIGKKPIAIPSGVEVRKEGQTLIVKGPKGQLSYEFNPQVGVEVKDNQIQVELKGEDKALWGLTRALVFNMVTGVTSGYSQKLQIEGVGFKASLGGTTLVLDLGFSHEVKVPAPSGITYSVEKNIVEVSGIDKRLVFQTASEIRKIKPPEPYKGKGIRYLGEVIKKKVGKKAVASAK